MMDANRTNPSYELKSELARYCLPAANRDSNRKLAWVNSICILFLLIGVLGARSASISGRQPPPLQEIIASIIEPPPPPPATAEEKQNQDEPKPDRPETPQVVVVTPESPQINFSVPTLGNLVVPSGVAAAPPLNPMKQVAPLQSRPASLVTTGSGGERPAPPYPKIALEEHQEGSVQLSITVTESGIIEGVEVMKSSGSALLDRSALEYVKKHWIIPPISGSRLYETTITFRLRKE
jgi:TonB family protein